MIECDEAIFAINRAAFGDVELDRVALERHAAGCDRCRARLAQFDVLSESLELAFPTEQGAVPDLRVAYWHEMDSPIGPLLLATGEDSRVRRVAFNSKRDSFVDGLLAAGWVPLRDAGRNARLVQQLEEYFAGQRQRFELPVDLTPLRPFHRAVLEACAQVPRGGWDTYGGLAAAVGKPLAARAVGNALGANPVPLIVPCHRILASGGRIGGYGGGLRIKRYLLALEGVAVA